MPTYGPQGHLLGLWKENGKVTILIDADGCHVVDLTIRVLITKTTVYAYIVENNALTPPAPQRISAAWRVRGGCGYERSARWKSACACG